MESHDLEAIKELAMRCRRLTRAKTAVIAFERMDIVCELFLRYNLSLNLISELTLLSVRSVRRYIDLRTAKADAKRSVENERATKAELNEYFGLLGRRTTLYQIQLSDRDYLQKLLSTFTSTQLRTFRAFFYDWKSVADIAWEENVTENAISRRLKKVRSSFELAGLPMPKRGDKSREIGTFSLPW